MRWFVVDKTYNGGNKVSKFKKMMSKLLVFTLALCMVVLTGCGKGSTNEKKLVVTVGDSKIYLDEMMFYIFMTESQLDQIDQMYQAYMGMSYWDQEYSEGVTVREYSKTTTMDMAVQYEILYTEAVKAGFKLSEEDKEASVENIEQIMEALSEAQLEKTGLTKEIVTTAWNKSAIAYNYMADLIEGFDIDDEGIRASINQEDYRQYDTQTLFVSTISYDEDGQSVEMSDSEKAEVKKKIDAYVEKAKAGEDFATLVEEDEDVVSSDRSFLVNDEHTTEEFKEAALKLKKEEVSNVLEMEDGYYIIKMVDDNSDESYESAVNEAIQEEENTRFQEAYEEMKNSYKITINEDVWGEIELGNVTLISAEEMQEEDGATGEVQEEDTTTEDEEEAASEEATEE